MNLRNTFTISGTIASHPITTDLPDGGRTIRFSIVSRNNYTKPDGTPTFETLPVSVYRSPDAMADPNRGAGTAGLLQPGDLVSVQGSVRNNNWVDNQGQIHFELVLQVEDADIVVPARV